MEFDRVGELLCPSCNTIDFGDVLSDKTERIERDVTELDQCVNSVIQQINENNEWTLNRFRMVNEGFGFVSDDIKLNIELLLSYIKGLHSEIEELKETVEKNNKRWWRIWE